MRADIRYWKGDTIKWLEGGDGYYRTFEYDNGMLALEGWNENANTFFNIGFEKAFWLNNDDFTEFTLPELIAYLHLEEDS
jgi:hypothetical protein